MRPATARAPTWPSIRTHHSSLALRAPEWQRLPAERRAIASRRSLMYLVTIPPLGRSGFLPRYIYNFRPRAICRFASDIAPLIPLTRGCGRGLRRQRRRIGSAYRRRFIISQFPLLGETPSFVADTRDVAIRFGRVIAHLNIADAPQQRRKDPLSGGWLVRLPTAPGGYRLLYPTYRAFPRLARQTWKRWKCERNLLLIHR